MNVIYVLGCSILGSVGIMVTLTPLLGQVCIELL